MRICLIICAVSAVLYAVIEFLQLVLHKRILGSKCIALMLDYERDIRDSVSDSERRILLQNMDLCVTVINNVFSGFVSRNILRSVTRHYLDMETFVNSSALSDSPVL